MNHVEADWRGGPESDSVGSGMELVQSSTLQINQESNRTAGIKLTDRNLGQSDQKCWSLRWKIENAYLSLQDSFSHNWNYSFFWLVHGKPAKKMHTATYCTECA